MSRSTAMPTPSGRPAGPPFRAAAAGLLALVVFSACAMNKAFNLDVPTKERTAASTIRALKCAAQQSGWNITFADESSVSAQKVVGMDNVPLTLNLRLQNGDPTKVVMTTHNPRGLSGNALHERPVVEALKNCGAPDVNWAPA